MQSGDLAGTIIFGLLIICVTVIVVTKMILDRK